MPDLFTPRSVKLADLFCGAGGTSTGAIEAIELLGYRADLTAINHWPVAIATHHQNHPGARTLCTGVDVVRPLELFKEGELDLLWASPECTHHSTARGGKPINDQSRATAWCVIRWAQELLPPVILIENVPEFLTWGPIGSNGRPLKSRKGETFEAWCGALRALGYKVAHRLICCADYGDPTTRKRLFVQAVRGRRRITWPDPTHARDGSADLFGSRKPWVPARAIIDWELQGDYIFNRKRSLADNTLKRILVGLDKQGLEPFILPGFGEREGQAPRHHEIDQPLPTLCAGGHFHLVDPFIVAMEQGGSVDSIDRPVRTITTAKGGAMAVVEPMIVELRGTDATHLNGSARSVEEPLGTVTAGGTHHGLAEAYLVQCAHGNGSDPNGDARRVKSLDDPMPTVCGNRGDMAVVQPYIIPQHGGHPPRSTDAPLGTVTTTSRGVGLAEPYVIGQQSGAVARPVSEPMPTVSTGGAIALVDPYVVKFYGTGTAADIDRPLDTVTTHERFGLAEADAHHAPEEVRIEVAVVIDGKAHALACIRGIWCLVCRRDGRLIFVAIRFRMLAPKELAKAQGFRDDYEFTGTKSDAVKQIGNAVPRNTARALVLAALGQTSDVASILDAAEFLVA